MSLENAPDEVKLAVDLIVLLEENQVAPETVLKALEIVRRDFEGKRSPHPTLSRWEREQTLKKATCVAFLRFISRYVCT